MSAPALIELLLMSFVLIAPTMMVAILATGVSRRPEPQLVRATVDSSDAADHRRLRAAA